MRLNIRMDPEVTSVLADDRQQLCQGSSDLGIYLSEKQIHQFEAFIRILQTYQGRLHLVSRTDNVRIMTRHVLPSLMVWRFLHGTNICDIGSGAGLPGIPLAIADHNLRIVLFESVEKKVRFLKAVKEKLALDRIKIIHGRAELYEGERFDMILLRAVGAIKKHIRTIDRLLTLTGKAVFYKTHRIEQELKQAQPLMKRFGFTAEVHKLYTPQEGRPLALVVLERTANRRPRDKA